MTESNQPAETQTPAPVTSSASPHIPASTILPEVTPKAIVLGILLSMVLAGANAYLGLLVGLTVSASIPAAVVSMALLRFFARSNILENNVVQTAASAGESLAAGVIFTLPALILMGARTEFRYLETTAIAMLGGLIGVMFTVPLRKVLVTDKALKFPEGVATAEVLKVGDSGGGAVNLGIGAALGALFKFGSAGLGLFTEAIESARRVGSSLVYGGTNVLPSLTGVGFIVGFNISALIVIGGAINWFIAIPIVAASNPWPDDASAVDRAFEIWSTQTRYLGVGAMVVGGLWTLLRFIPKLFTGISASLKAARLAREQDNALPRTDRDLSMTWVFSGILAAIIPLGLLIHYVTGRWDVAAVMGVVMMIAGFLFSAVASYMAGLVGSSNNPISGVTIATLVFTSLMLLLLYGGENPDLATASVAAIMIGAVVCCAAAIGGDNTQDLKAGHILGATPASQQVMQFVGVIAASLVLAPVLNLLLNAYGFVGMPGADPESQPQALNAPQAALMNSLVSGIFQRELPWTFIGVGMALAATIILIDLFLERLGTSFRAPVLAVAVGIYLPIESEVPIFLGGIIAWMASSLLKRTGQSEGKRSSAMRRGLLFAAGLITGEALIGIVLAIPIAISQGTNPISLTDPKSPFYRDDLQTLAWPGAALLAGILALMLWLATRTSKDANGPLDRSTS